MEKLYYGHNCNTYVLGEKGKQCVIIDPGFNKNNCLINHIKKNYSGVEAVLLTHGHYDHILALKDIINEFNCPTYMYFDEIEKLYSAKLNCSTMSSQEFTFDEIKPIGIYDKEILSLAGEKIEVIHTPFHTSGCVCYYICNKGVVFTGDTLFHLAIGRFDLPTSEPRKVFSSLEKLTKLPKDTKVYPGHSESTTIGNELEFNSYLKK